MIPDMRQRLERLRAERPDESLETPVMRVRECQKAMDRAAKIVGMHRITHHDIELHTGAFAEAFDQDLRRKAELERLVAGAKQAHALGLKVNPGHGLNYHCGLAN
jgi:pyridoxine 5'-phosphate synthase PdxJ